MRLKTSAIVLVLLCSVPKSFSGDIDDELLWEQLVKGTRNETPDSNFPEIEDSDNLDLLETYLNSVSDDTSEANQMPEIEASNNESSTIGDKISDEMKSSFTWDQFDPLSERVSRQPNFEDTPFIVDSPRHKDRGIKGATSKPKPGQTSLVIIFDGTGSMLDDLKQLQKGAEDIIGEITKRENNPIYNYIFIPFRDPDYGPVVNTIDQAELLEALDNVDLIGGGDCPESSIGGINAGLDIALPKSFVYIFTDATAQDYKLADETIKMIQEKQITLTFLLTGFCNSKNSPGYYVYETLAAISNGQVYNLQKTDIKDVLESIKQFLDVNLVPISYVYSENPGPQNIELDVSKNLKEFTVSLAGDKPNITVIDPDKEEYKEQKDVVDLENLKIVNVQDPKPGKWNVHTQSESEHSVKLTAVSDVVFKFGFSTTQPNSIVETDVNPTKNVNNILAVSTSNNSLLHNLTSAEIVLFNAKNDPDEKRQLQIKLPLKRHESVECDDESCLYLTKSFPPPLSLFKIYVNGFDSDGNPLKYLLSTAIQAINGEIPRVSIEESFVEVTEGHPVEILCKVFSTTPAAIHWTVNGEIRNAIQTEDKDIWKYQIDAAQLSDAGKYTCNARNVHGKDKGQVTLIVKEKIIPLQVKMVETNMLSTENDTDYQISCFIRPRQKATIEWYFNGRKINAENYLDWMTQNDNLVINRVNRKHTGEYTCVATNKRETKNATGYLNVLYEPEILDRPREDLQIPFGRSFNLSCNATGNPTPKIVWHRQNLSEIVDGQFEKFAPDDKGLYLCEASNGIGQTAWREVKLLGAPAGPPEIIPLPYENIEKKLGDDLDLKCECLQCDPVYYYKWTRGENPYYQTGTIIGIGPNRDEHTHDFQYNLELKNLNASDDGYYICELGNEFGIDTLITRVTILEKPTIVDLTSSNLIKDRMIKVNRGDGIQIDCKAKGSPIPEIHWLKDDAGIVPAPHIHTANERLILRNVSEADMGEYKCVASNSLGTASEQVLLYVVVPPIFQPQKDTIITAHEGQFVEIECDVFAMPFPNIKWSFNNNDLNLTGTDDRYQLIGSQLSFIAKYDDNGVFKCKASNEAGEGEQEVALIVYVAPKLYPENDDTASARVNKNVTLKCRAEGFPVPDLIWTSDGEALTNSSKAYILKGGDLFLVEVTPDMAGPYICEASNKVGEKQRTTFLTVTEPPKVLSHFDPYINVTTDTSFSLMCAAQGTPRPDIFWAKDGEKYTDGPRQQYLDVTYGEISSGNYTCVAQSPEGADTKTVIISAIEPPRLVDVQSILKTKINVTEGDTLEIICPFMYATKITWFKDDFKFHAEQSDPASTTLRLPAATLGDRGNYTCFAENEAGSLNFTQEVKVLAPPRVITNDVIERFGDTQIPVVTVQSGEDLEMNCPMEGFPQPKVKWMKDNTLISTEPDLVLKNVQPFHDGRYDCEARNPYGSADYSYILKVLAEPTTHLPKHTRKEIHEGGNLELECSYIGNPPPIISWQRNNVTLAETDVPLVLKNIQPKERGIYKCVGTNSVGSAEVEYTVDVLETPKFTFVNDDVKISESDDLMLRCATRGNPLPIVVWTYNGQMIIGSSKIPRNVEKSYGLLELDESGNPISNGHSNEIALNNGLVSTASPNDNVKRNHFYGKVYYDKDSVSLMLIIKSLDRKLPGTYTCHAVNAMGSVEKDVKVAVLVPPQLQGRDVDLQPSVNLTVLGGLPMILFCPWHGVPTPTIEWLKNNIRLKTDYRTQISHDGHVATILISDTSDNGTFQCRAINEAGFGQKEFNINVLAPPHFRLGNLMENRLSDEPERLLDDSPQHVVPGEKIIFNCPVTGNPPPSVFWLETTMGTANETKLLPETSTQLILDNVEKSATYTCYANNSLGFTEKRYEVLVLKTPEIRDFQPQQTVHEHHTISLNCPVIGGSPTPEITWLKNGVPVVESSKNVFLSQDKTTLKVLNAKKDDSAVYTCRATNLAGEQEKDINVTVITPVVWSEWDPWSPCSHSCGIGVSTRKRRCIRLDGELPRPSDPVCAGRNHESKTCEVSPCPIDGGWGVWSNWTSCSKHCWNPKDKHKPTMKRYRECDSPKPALGGRACPGIDYEEAECNIQPCSIDGGWSAWTKWSPCSVSCGSGFATRYRECNSPVPLNGGRICMGSALESQICNAGPCPTHGGWTEWSSWSECSQTCGTGYRKRTRTCTNPEPHYGGLHCLGDNVELVKCRLRKCENSELLRSLNEMKKSYNPGVQFESKMENWKDSVEYTTPEMDDGTYDYAEGSSSYSTPMNSNSRATRYPGEEMGTHVVVKVEKLTPIDKDTTQINFHPGLAPIVIKKVLPCNPGFQMTDNGTCADINECLDPAANPCSYECRNTPGGFVCSCPPGQILSLDLRSCIRLATTTNDYEMSDPAARSFEFEEGCPNGYYENNNECQDIDECENAEDDCNIDQTCLNTNGSYLCIPTSCPEEYKRDEISRQCVQMCNTTHPCFEGAQISQTLSYTLLTLHSITQSEPFLKLVNYDINRIPLAETKFFLENDTNPTLFRLSTIPMRRGIAYLYGSNKIKKEKLYNVKVKAYSYDSSYSNLLYVTRFVIYLYVL